MIILALGTFQILLIVLGSLLVLLFPLLALISVLKNNFSGNDNNYEKGSLFQSKGKH